MQQGKFFLTVRPLTNAIEEICLSVGSLVSLSEASVVIGFIIVFISNRIHIYCIRFQQIMKLSYVRRKAPRIFSCEARNYNEANLRCTGWLSVAQFCIRLFERTIKASDLRFALKCRNQLPLEVLYFRFLKFFLKNMWALL